MFEVIAATITAVMLGLVAWAWAWKYIGHRRIARSVRSMEAMLDRLEAEMPGMVAVDRLAAQQAGFFAALAPRACILFAADSFSPQDLLPTFGLEFNGRKQDQEPEELNAWMSVVDAEPGGEIPDWLRQHIADEMRYALYTWVYASPGSLFRWIVALHLGRMLSQRYNIAELFAAQYRFVGGRSSLAKSA